ncbi:MAG: hypothetical protein GX028_02455 [Clostridiaceae bacterium]|nr:hypothetical protein [Clostridiaceae bacterium]
MITKTINSSIIVNSDVRLSGINAILAVDDILQIGNISDTAVSERFSASVSESANSDNDSNCTDRRLSDLPVQIFAIAEGITTGATGRIAARTAVESLLFDVGDYIRKRDFVNLDIADFADIVSENADHAIRQQLTAWQGIQTGTSLAWIMIEKDIAYTYSVGDAALVLYREGMLYRITDPVDKNEMLLQDFYLGYRSRDCRLLPANLNRMPLKKSDIILLLSSELSRMLDDHEIETVLARPDAFASIASSLCDAARSKGTLQELAAATVKVHAIENPPQAPQQQDNRTVKKSRIKKLKSRP